MSTWKADSPRAFVPETQHIHLQQLVAHVLAQAAHAIAAVALHQEDSSPRTSTGTVNRDCARRWTTAPARRLGLASGSVLLRWMQPLDRAHGSGS